MRQVANYVLVCLLDRSSWPRCIVPYQSPILLLIYYPRPVREKGFEFVTFKVLINMIWPALLYVYAL